MEANITIQYNIQHRRHLDTLYKITNDNAFKQNYT
jgi:hypothetical protein